MEFSGPEYWHGWPFPSPGDLPNPGIKPRYSTLQADSLPTELWGKPNVTLICQPITIDLLNHNLIRMQYILSLDFPKENVDKKTF